ncbi:50S ribosomal protein L31 [Candidatus Saccharibacteria bacterium RIFCSPHIGHO2_12_FULL_41_12]|nr:MAG: 50S ribosomal protein L31 [Candidatus Saccharibacteria bacterium RIFCSPHIGHO2_12_FULL_41_12]
MKQGIHPDNYRPVVYQDISNGTMFLVSSTAKAEETIKYTDGKEYPLVKVHISSSSHPFYTGQEKLLDVEGRVDKFKARKAAAAKAREKTKAKLSKNSAKDTTEEVPEEPTPQIVKL